jgi:hypothetical protein
LTKKLGQGLVEHALGLVFARLPRGDQLVHPLRLARDDEVKGGWTALGAFGVSHLAEA